MPEEEKLPQLKWRTIRRRVSDLVPYEGNPRRMTEKQEEDLKRSLERFDLVEIPAVDIDSRIISGHQRMRIMWLLGRGEEVIDVRVPNRKLTEEEFKEYNLRANKNLGEWDYAKLIDFDAKLLEFVGFDEIDLEDIFHKIEKPVEKELDENIETKNKCPKCGYKW